MLTELPAITIWLEAHIAAGGVAGEKVSGSKDEPIPLRLDVLDLIGPRARNDAAPLNPYTGYPEDQRGELSFEAMLRAHAETVHWNNHKPWPDDHTVQGFVAYLAANLTWIVSQEWVTDFMTDLEQAGKRARGIAAWQEETKREKNERCENCGMTAMVRHIAQGVVRCERGLGGCGKQRPVTDYEWQARHVTEASA